MFVTEKTANEIANDLLNHFEVGSLHSRSKVSAIIPHALDELADRGLPKRRSLAAVIAKKALFAWQETVFKTTH